MVRVPDNRRPVAARQTRWASRAAHWLAALGVRPNQVSLASIGCACIAGSLLIAGLGAAGPMRIALLLGAALCIEARLLCNLLDGMLAVECGLGTPAGAVFNELPDRIADPIVLVCAGYAAGHGGWAPALGWLAACLALLTAYVRALAGSLGAAQSFCGPMAKQQRMQTVAAASALAAFLPGAAGEHVLFAALAIVAVGTALTVIRRTRRLVRELETR